MAKKIFLLGMNKAGTTSFHHFFMNNGIKSIHWNKGRLAQKMYDNLDQHLPLLNNLGSIQAFSDMVVESENETKYFHVDHLDELLLQNPNALYIFNDRNEDSWINSMKNHANGSFFMRETERFSGDKYAVTEHWSEVYRTHKQNVLNRLSGRSNFIHFDIEKDDFSRVISFFRNNDVDIKDPIFPTSNVTSSDTYSSVFYQNQVKASQVSARLLLGHLWSIYQATSIIDFGCGLGAWLTEAEKLGATKAVGLDGAWVDRDKLLSATIDFRESNFDEPQIVDYNFDLAISLEVAEHLDESKSMTFVESITHASDVVLFGAAIPLQGGTNHVNEQPQSYWIEKFQSLGYTCFDVVRPFVWDDIEIEPWYKQNIFVFVNQNRNDLCDVFEKIETKGITDIVHPDMYARPKLSEKDVNFLRDTAISLEYYNAELAHGLMDIAHKLRPRGEFINTKLTSYKKLLGKK